VQLGDDCFVGDVAVDSLREGQNHFGSGGEPQEVTALGVDAHRAYIP